MSASLARLAFAALLAVSAGCRGPTPAPQASPDADAARVAATLVDMRILAVTMEAINAERWAYPKTGDHGIRVGPFALVPVAILEKEQPSLGHAPSVDPWGHPYLLWSFANGYAVVSTGSDGVIGATRPLERLLRTLAGRERFAVKGETSCLEDEIVLADGQLVQWPAREAARCGTPAPDLEPSGMPAPEAKPAPAEPPPSKIAERPLREPAEAARGAAAATTGDGTDRLVRYYRRKTNIPPDMDVHVTGLHPAPVAGVLEGTLHRGVAEVPFTMSADGRYAIFAPLEDIAVDPFAAVMRKISLIGAPARGPAGAPVTIVEYGDFQCPFSARAFTTIEAQVLNEYSDKVRFVFKNLPLPTHPWAEPAAIAAECAKLQGDDAYWAVYRGLFLHQHDIDPGNLREKVRGFVAASGADAAAVDACIEEKGTLPAVKAQAEEARAVGINGTPMFLVNGRPITGAQPYETFKAVIDGELSQ